MSAVIQPDPTEADELDERLVDQSRRLKRMAGSLATELSVGDLLELIVYEGDEAIQRARIAGGGGTDQIGNLPPVGPRAGAVVHQHRCRLRMVEGNHNQR